MTDWARVLEDDLKWREAELASLKLVAITSSENRVLHQASLRACWAMLYAHFEGFTKFCWELMFDLIQSKRVHVSTLNHNFQMLALEKPFRTLRKSLDARSLYDFFTTNLPAILSSEAMFSADCRLETESNLWPNVFQRECLRAGLGVEEIEKHTVRIRALVARRNDIAHGKTMTIKSVNEYTEYEHATLLVMHDLAIQVLGVLQNESYRTPSPIVGDTSGLASIESSN